ncbi:hypothetical protein BABINDRAFT_161460 [Babjeviella inositovora NRRL Y-12698]|uniref:enoyl-[acyl-carrier-protein] reductase n=1 Tax=Babjeviella inositovora NRRL Y-12698 TaxID=984486 RepID=A0A1E3QQ22_9ASCO|nr:uncharacterized protein BABINDRAFT_161460 [Babjeviella inositovora NRRL Y-12698]ODQ79760.1 hypothetical protein BABINDRAFT_161460 [Babjeviella inositovora NRRL Y-12698]
MSLSTRQIGFGFQNARRWASTTARAVIYTDHGEPAEVLRVRAYQLEDPAEASGNVLLQAVAAPINPSDINQIQGVYPSKPAKTLEFGTPEPAAPCGNEGLFQVLKIDPKVTDLQVGDWVIPKMPNFGTWRTHALTPSKDLIKVSNGLSVQQAATISVNPCTAYQLLTIFKKLAPGDFFIQNGGNSAVGKYAIQIGKQLGLKSISVVRDRPDFAVLEQELLELGATHVITEEQSADRAMGTIIKEWVGKGKQISLALNCISGKSATNIARKLGKDGIMATYGGMSKQPVILPTSLHIFKNITSAGFWLTANTKDDPEGKIAVIDKINEYYLSGKLKEAKFTESKFDIANGTNEQLLQAFLTGIQAKNGKQGVVFK